MLNIVKLHSKWLMAHTNLENFLDSTKFVALFSFGQRTEFQWFIVLNDARKSKIHWTHGDDQKYLRWFKLDLDSELDTSDSSCMLEVEITNVELEANYLLRETNAHTSTIDIHFKPFVWLQNVSFLNALLVIALNPETHIMTIF